MRKMIIILCLLIPVVAFGYTDHRGHNLDSLERVVAQWTPDKLSVATSEQRHEYRRTCYRTALGYLQLEPLRSMHYASLAIENAEQDGDDGTVFDASIIMGQHYWAREKLDSARIYYSKAGDALAIQEANWANPDRHDLEAMQSRLWGTLGNFYAVQDSLDKFAYYYAKAGEVFEKWEWWEDCSTLHRNIGEVYTDNGELKKAKPEYELGLQYARQSGDSLMIAHALYGLGRWYQKSGKTTKALEYLTQAEEYFGNHPREEAEGRANTLAIMNAAREDLYRNARMLAITSFLVLFLSLGGTLLVRRLRLTKQELTETSAVLDETIEELRPAAQDDEIVLTEQERKITSLLVEGLSTKEIADKVCLGVNTVLWYRKRLYAKLDVHSAAAFTNEAHRRGLV